MQGYFSYVPELMKWVEWEREHEGAFNASHLQPSIYEYYPPGTQAVQAFTGSVSSAFFLLTCVLTCQLRAMVRQRDQIKPSTCGAGGCGVRCGVGRGASSSPVAPRWRARSS